MRPTGPRSQQMRQRRIAYPRPLKPRDRADHVETQVVERQRLATSLEVIVMLVHHARLVPFSERAPVQRAGFTGHTGNIECPGRMYLVRGIARNRGLFDGYRYTPNFDDNLKRDQEFRRSEPTLAFPR